MADVFISYAPADAELALRIAKSLERSGISATRGPVQFTGNWAVRLHDDLDACAAVLALWSRAALREDWVATEAAIGAHFGQTVSVRTDSALDRNQIPAQFREGAGVEIVDVFETEVAPNGWGESAAEALDRKLAPVAGRIRALKARGPVVTPAVGAGAVPPPEEVQRRLANQFAWLRSDGGDRSGQSAPNLAATRRESAFRAGFSALAAMDYPSDIRAGLVEFGDPATARRGLARIYAEALSRNDKDFWGHVGRLAAPLSSTLAIAGLQRSGAGADVISDFADPRDLREMHGARFGRTRSRGAGVVMWPIAAVAVGLALLVGAPRVAQLQGIDIASSMPKFSWPQARPPEVKDVAANEIPPPPWSGAEVVAPAPMPTDREVVRAQPLPTLPPPAAVTPTAVTPTVPAPPALEAAALAPAKLRWCRGKPTSDADEFVLEVMEGERLFDVAGRAYMDTPVGRKLIAERNAKCLGERSLTLTDGRVLTGSDLLFAGDRLVIPLTAFNRATLGGDGAR